MNLEGLEMIAVLIVIVLFVKVLEQFGLIEAGLEGKGVLFSGLSFFFPFRLLSCSEARGTCRWDARHYLSHRESNVPIGGCAVLMLKLGCFFFRRDDKLVS